MWKKVFHQIFGLSINKNQAQKQIKGVHKELEDYEEETIVIDSNCDAIELQIDGNWVSKNIIQSLFVDNYRQKLLKVCGQKQLFKLENIITKNIFDKMEVLWSGSYSEVFRAKDLSGRDIIFKISLINRRNENGVIVQNITSILSDIINTKRLSDLKSMSTETAVNYCENFVNVLNIYYVWSHRLLFNKSEDKSYDENSARFEYLICQQTFAGKDLDAIKLFSPSKGLSLISQLIASIAIAEESMEFEHRDLHCSNILIEKTKNKFATYAINGNKFYIKVNGIKVTIIDTTFSRTKVKVAPKSSSQTDYVVKTFYKDLSTIKLDNYPDNDLKSVYLRQRDITRNKWHKFWPKTNIIWLKYNIDQISDRVDKWSKRYFVNNNTKYLHDYNLLMSWKTKISDYESAKDFAHFCQLFSRHRI